MHLASLQQEEGVLIGQEEGVLTISKLAFSKQAWGKRGALALWNMSQMAERGWCTEAMMVWPSAARQDMWSMMLSAANASSPVVGSSRNRMLGLAISEHDMVSRRFSPPAPAMKIFSQIFRWGSKDVPCSAVLLYSARGNTYWKVSEPEYRSQCRAECSPLRPRTRMPPGRCPPTCKKEAFIPRPIKGTAAPSNSAPHTQAQSTADRTVQSMTNYMLDYAAIDYAPQ